MSDTNYIYDPENLYKPGYVHDILNFHGIRLKKSLGQNFMVDRHGVDKIIKAAELSPDDIVLEIGAGLGHLTFQLLEKVKQVISVELDDRFIPILKGLFSNYNNFTLVQKLTCQYRYYPLIYWYRGWYYNSPS